jgi:hypothetical protein
MLLLKSECNIDLEHHILNMTENDVTEFPSGFAYVQ